MIKYKTRSIRLGVTAKIERIEILRESPSCVFFLGGRWALKETEAFLYHDTWKDAHDYLLRHAEDHVMGAQKRLKDAKEARDSVLAMKKPRGD